jgi:DNA-binding NarL/FixJ family response regulator
MIVTPVTIFVCEPQPVLVEGLERVVGRHPDLRMVGHASELGVTVAEFPKARPDILLLGQPSSAESILPLLEKAREADLGASLVIWVSDLSEMDSFRALQMGARGMVGKTQSADTLVECLRTVGSGSVYLESRIRSRVNSAPRRNGALRITRREREIVELVCGNKKNKEIADALSITPATVKIHLTHIFEKTGVRDRFQLALQGRQFLSSSEAPGLRSRAAGA